MATEGHNGGIFVSSTYSGDPNLSADPVFTSAPTGARFLDEAAPSILWVKDVRGTWSQVGGVLGYTNLSDLVCCGPFEGHPNPYLEVTPGGTPFPTGYTWYEDSTKAIKVYEVGITRDGVKPTVVTHKAYYPTGILAITATDTITYDGPFEVSRQRVLS